MSDTQPPDAEDLAPGANIPNFAVLAGVTVNGKPTTRVTFGEPPRFVNFRKLEIEDQWDIAEIAGESPTSRWMGMTLMAASLTEIDGVPMFGGELNRKILRDRLSKLGTDGLNAVSAALETLMLQPGNAEAGMGAVKN